MGTLVTIPGSTCRPKNRALPIAVSEEATPEDDSFQRQPGGALRGFVFVMLFNLLLLLCGSAFWLLLRL
jgi:hypothetical protein